jgi:hypothetical protein
MQGDVEERWQRLCEQARNRAGCRAPDASGQEINRLLQEKDECLKQTRTGIRQQHKATIPELSGSIVIAAVSRACPVCSTGMSSSPDRRELSNICVIVLTLSAYFD